MGTKSGRLTGLQSIDAGFGAQVGQVDVGLAAVNDGVRFLARPVRPHAVRHRNLSHTQPDTLMFSYTHSPIP